MIKTLASCDKYDSRGYFDDMQETFGSKMRRFEGAKGSR
jgi:hypothetical protein